MANAKAQLKGMYEILGDYFSSPCNYGYGDMDMTVDEYMAKKAENWCEEHCCRVSDSACWQKFLELRIADRGTGV
jgi:hypothetical protein